MTRIPREAWQYAVLLLVLFALASVAVRRTIGFLEPRLPAADLRPGILIVTSLTLGFMLIAGAFGIWAIQFSAESEGRRRVGRFVDMMDYLRDGLVVVDRRGRITGLNPTAKNMGCAIAERGSLCDLFPCLSPDDARALLGSRTPSEIERDFPRGESARTLRFRTQPTENLSLVLVSDVTAMSRERVRGRQAAKLQLLGQIARGVAHDFNDLLCGIANHASLLSRMSVESPDSTKWVGAITRRAEKGVALAKHLMDLAEHDVAQQETERLSEHIEAAASLLRNSLPLDWKIQREEVALPPIGLTGSQIEQVIFNLGLLAADALAEPGVLQITVAAPDPRSADGASAGGRIAGYLRVMASAGGVLADAATQPVVGEGADTGVIVSFVRSLLEEAGGVLRRIATPGGQTAFEVGLPLAAASDPYDDSARIPPELAQYVAGWHVTLAASSGHLASLKQRLHELGLHVHRVENVASLLALVQDDDKPLHGIMVENHVLREELEGLLKALIRLRPAAGLVVLTEYPAEAPPSLADKVVFAPQRAAPDQLVMALIDARSQAARRV
jgi:nitrogen-specific signal transduction histidine kinase